MKEANHRWRNIDMLPVERQTQDYRQCATNNFDALIEVLRQAKSDYLTELENG